MKYLISILLIGVQTMQAQYSISLNLSPGSRHSLNAITRVKAEADREGHKETMTATLDARAEFEVTAVTDSGYVLACQMDSLHFRVNAPSGNMEINSGRPEAGSAYPAPKPILLTVLRNGSIRKIHFPDTTAFTRMMSFFPGADQIWQILRMMPMAKMKKGPDRKKMREDFEKMTTLYPYKKVALNEEWGWSIQPDSVSGHSAETSYKLTGLASGIYTIQGKSRSKANNSQTQGDKTPAGYDLDGSGDITLMVDAGTGWIIQGRINREMSGRLAAKDQGPDKPARIIPIKVSINTEMTGR